MGYNTRHQFLLLILGLCFFRPVMSEGGIAIVGALDEEIELLKSQLTEFRTEQIHGIDFHIGKIYETDVILVLCGIGKVNAAMTTTLLIDHYQPEWVLFTGVAGGLTHHTQIGDIVISERLVQHDFGAIRETGFEQWATYNKTSRDHNPLYLLTDSVLLHRTMTISQTLMLDPVGERIPAIHSGTIVTGDVFVASKGKRLELVKEHNALAVEMEGAALAQVCYQLNVPFLVIRSISDTAGETASMDFSQFVRVASRNSAQLLLSLLANQ